MPSLEYTNPGTPSLGQGGHIQDHQRIKVALEEIKTDMSNHGHTTTEVTGLAEFVRDTVAAALRSGVGISIAHDDTADTITITGSTGGLDAEGVRDTIAAFMVAGANISVTHNDAGDQLTIAVTGLGNAASRNVGTGSTQVAAGDAPTAAVNAHTALVDPHPIYLTKAEADVLYALIGAAAEGVPTFIGPDAPATSAPKYIWYQGPPGGPYTPVIEDNAVPTSPGVMSAPTGTIGNQQVLVQWVAPTGTQPMTYEIQRATNSGFTTGVTTVTSAATGTSFMATGLTNGTAYYFRIRASNAAIGGSQQATWSPASTAYIPATVPDAPTIGTATGGDGQASVAFSAPGNNGGSAITGYTAISSPGGIQASGASSPITVPGLTNGTAYTFTVVATNARGDSAPSAASNAITPAAGGGNNYQMTSVAGGSPPFLGLTSQAATYVDASNGSGIIPDVSGFLGSYDDGSNKTVLAKYLEVDTSPIGDSETISSVTLEVYATTAASGVTDSGVTIEVYALDFGGYPLDANATDWQTTSELTALVSANKRVATFTVDSTGSNWHGTTGWKTFTLESTNLAANINKTGMTRLLLTTNLHRTGAAPGGGDYGVVGVRDVFDPMLRLTVVTS